MNKTYICIDLKSFYASVECVERNLNPLEVNLVVADKERTEKTICLAVSPSLKAFGVSSRPRLFEVVQTVKNINNERLKKNNYKAFKSKSYYAKELENTDVELDYIVAPPQMAKYIAYSTNIYKIYLKYIDSNDIHVYSIDEVFMDVTHYLNAYKMDAEKLARTIIKEVLDKTGITATAGIGTNMYLAKIAMDIEAKKMKPDCYGVRVAYLNEELYKEKLWDHKPLSSFWRIGIQTERHLARMGLYTMGDIARAAIENEDLLFDEFGINAELLIDHAFGIETTEIKDIKAYKPKSTSQTVGQVLHCGYKYIDALVIVKEMAYELALKCLEKDIVSKQITITIGYDIESTKGYSGELEEDRYKRIVPKGVHSSINLAKYTNSGRVFEEAALELFNHIVDKSILVRRLFVCATSTKYKDEVIETKLHQYSIFEEPKEYDKTEQKVNNYLKKEETLNKTVLELKKKFGKNSVLKGTDLEEGANTILRNNQIGGHKA